jgi:putative hemolysin
VERPAETPGDVDAGLTIEEFAERTGIELEDGPYETAAGYVVHRLGRLAVEGDAVEVGGHRIVVVAVDRHRITRLGVRS